MFIPAAVIEGTIFCAHAGLSPQLYDLDLVSSLEEANIQGPTGMNDLGLLSVAANL